MENLSIEEKAKRYDKAIKIAKSKIKNDKDHVLYEDDIIELFPELKESEDERIRKALIKHVKQFPEKSLISTVPIPKVIAWLETQGESYTKRDVDDAYLKGVTDTKNEIEKQYEANYQIRKDIATFIFNYKGDIKDRAKWIDYLGIKVSFVEPKFHEGDWVVSPNGVYWHIDAIQSCRYEVTSNTGQCSNWPLDTNIYHLWTIQDAKDGDVLSYRNGQWIFILKALENNNSIIEYYTLLSEDGLSIKDAASTVLISSITPATKEQRDLLFAKMKEAGYEWDEEKKELKKIADEEQIKKNLQDNSFRRMFEQKPAWSEKYIADVFEKVGLAKIVREQSNDNLTNALQDAMIELSKFIPQSKQEWSEEDEEIINKISIAIANQYSCDTAIKIENWLKFFRPQNTWKPSEEQLKSLKEVIDVGHFTSYPNALETLYEQLKKLMEDSYEN